MVSILQRWKASDETYHVWQLINHRKCHGSSHAPNEHIICDLDKTYLETAFESLVKMAKIPFETAQEKVTVPGAAETLMMMRWGDIHAPLPLSQTTDYPRALHFVSSSPPQLRNVIEEKMFLDGLDWCSDTFKNQAYNLRKGRFDLLKQQVAYKTGAILRLIAEAPSNSTFYMIGDNAESDPFVYLGVKLFVEGHLTLSGYQSYLQLSKVSTPVIEALLSPYSENRPKAQVKSIYIRKLPNYPLHLYPPLSDLIQWFPNFLFLSAYAHRDGLIEETGWQWLRERFAREYGLSKQTFRFDDSVPELPQSEEEILGLAKQWLALHHKLESS